MALYTDTVAGGVADTRLAQYSGLRVPSVTLPDLVAEASGLIEAYIGYVWASTAFPNESVTFDRAGLGRLRNADEFLCPVTAVSAISVPPNAQYYGPSVDLSMLDWTPDGSLILAYPVIYSPQRWVNPVPLGRVAQMSAALKLYPDTASVTYTAGRTDPPPVIFQDVCIRLIALLLVERANLTGLAFKEERAGDSNYKYRDDPMAEILRPLKRYRR